MLKRFQSFQKRKQFLKGITTVLVLAYASTCLFLLVRQRHLIYRPVAALSMQPNAPDFKLPYETVWIPIANSQSKLHAWWIPASKQTQNNIPLPNEPIDILKSPKVMLYLCGAGRNKRDYNYLARVSAFRQLGFSVLLFDYRGYGLSPGEFPHESHGLSR